MELNLLTLKKKKCYCKKKIPNKLMKHSKYYLIKRYEKRQSYFSKGNNTGC